MDELISRQQAIDAFNTNIDELVVAGKENVDAVEKYLNRVIDKIKELPSAQPEQTKMIKEIREWINSGNRGSADYFIVDKIEEILNKYE